MKRVVALFIFILIFTPTLFAEDTDESPRVVVQISPETQITGKPLTVTLIVDYPEPEDVNVIPPPFAGSLSLERFMKIPGSRRQTIIEYRFIPERSGFINMESFTVICPVGITATKPFMLNIINETEEQKPPAVRFVWEGIPSQIQVGENVVIFLRLVSGDFRMPPSGFFSPDVPVQAILSSMPLSPEERAGGIAAKFNLIPLGENIYLPARTLQFENTIYEIPAMQINVTDRAIERLNETLLDETENKLTEDVLTPLIMNPSNKSRQQRIFRLSFFYFVLIIVIILMVVCLYLVLK